MPEPQCCLQAKAGKPGKGRLAMLKGDEAKFCAPRTRIPTPAPKKKAKPVAVSGPSFVSKIPSPKSASEAGSLPSTCTPEPAPAEQACDKGNGAETATSSQVSTEVLPCVVILLLQEATACLPEYI